MFGRARLPHARGSALRQLCVTVYLATEPHAMLRGNPPAMTLVLTVVVNVSARDTEVEILHGAFEPSFDDQAVSEHAHAVRDGRLDAYDHRGRRSSSPERRRLMVGDLDLTPRLADTASLERGPRRRWSRRRRARLDLRRTQRPPRARRRTPHHRLVPRRASLAVGRRRRRARRPPPRLHLCRMGTGRPTTLTRPEVPARKSFPFHPLHPPLLTNGSHR